MNKMIGFAGAAALVGILASCGSASTSGASLSISAVRTEYVDGNGNFVSCDNTTYDGGATYINTTDVATYFSTSGSVSSVNINLRGVTTTAYDGNYSTTFSNSDLGGGNGSYKATFYTNSSTALVPQGLSKQGIIVSPSTTVSIKQVTPTNYEGKFFSAATLTDTSGNSGTATSYYLGGGQIPVYGSCYVNSTTGSTL